MVVKEKMPIIQNQESFLKIIHWWVEKTGLIIVQGGKRPQTPPPQRQLQASQEIYTCSIKISSMSDSGAKFHEPGLKFNH